MADSKISALPAVTAPSGTDEIPVNQAGTTRKSTLAQLAAFAAGRTFCISPTGSDSTGDGSVGNPWASLAKFIANGPRPGDTLLCRGGTYSAGAWSPYATSVNGVAGSPITIAAYPGETPVFDGGGGASTYFLILSDSDFWTLDGLTLQNYKPTADGVVTALNTTAAVDSLTIRNCTISMASGLSTTEHGVYLGAGTTNVTIQGCTFKARYPAEASTGAGVEVFHQPTATGVVIERCVFDGWKQGIQVWAEEATPVNTGRITRCTFVRCYDKIDLRFHGAYTVRDNAGDGADDANLYDPNNSASTTADHNYWSQTITPAPDYDLAAGDSAILGASDGTSAGWRPASSEVVVGAPVVPVSSMRIPDGYVYDLIGRLTLPSRIRLTVQGTGRLVLSDDFRARSRIVLAGRGF